jgi:hypothetical protein
VGKSRLREAGYFAEATQFSQGTVRAGRFYVVDKASPGEQPILFRSEQNWSKNGQQRSKVFRRADSVN